MVLKLTSTQINNLPCTIQLQQCLPFTVLKLVQRIFKYQFFILVAIVLTVYGIETGYPPLHFERNCPLVATALTVHGIEARRR